MGPLQYGSHGAAVAELQKRLNNNDFKLLTPKLVVDGEFGPITASAVQNLKYWLGYPKEEISPIAGIMFIDLLTRKAALPKEYYNRRVLRLKEIGTQDALRTRAFSIIKGELGTLEEPSGSNHIKYNDWWGWGNVAYCVIGVAWSWVKAGSRAFEKGVRWANTDAMLEDAKYGRNGIHLTAEPKKGDPGVIDFDGHSDPDHAITFVKNNGDGTCETIEFNTTNPNNWLQGVWRRDRPLRNCWFFEVEK